MSKPKTHTLKLTDAQVKLLSQAVMGAEIRASDYNDRKTARSLHVIFQKLHAIEFGPKTRKARNPDALTPAQRKFLRRLANGERCSARASHASRYEERWGYAFGVLGKGSRMIPDEMIDKLMSRRLIEKVGTKGGFKSSHSLEITEAGMKAVGIEVMNGPLIDAINDSASGQSVSDRAAKARAR
jgi:hypothetical protein